jgi:glyoxylase-like metal-dependent hydrolase (beta-lactamase superfamily II)
MSPPIVIDLDHRGVERGIASFLLPGAEPVLVDCGPATCVRALEAGLAEQGLGLTDVRHLLLTHIHLDHAGAAGTLVRRHPGLRVYVGEVGAPHLVDPSKLEASARRLYGDEFDELWGELAPVPEENVVVVADRAVGLEAFATPGHARHHVTYFAPDGSCFVGDAAGVRIAPAAHILPVAPPPDIDLAAWAETLDAVASRRPDRLCLPHFGVFDDVDAHLDAMRRELRAWAERVRAGATLEEFVAEAEEELAAAVDERTAVSYRTAAPVDSSWIGLRRYWDTKAETSDPNPEQKEAWWRTS